MKFPDPLTLKSLAVGDTIIFAGSQLTGVKHLQEDYYNSFNDECFVIADGVSEMSHSEVAAKLAGETAIWGYKHVRQRPFYWADKRLLLKRIFRSCNLTLWQKRKEYGFEAGLGAALGVVIASTNKVWAGSVGDGSIFIYRESLIDEMTPPDIDKKGKLTDMLGIKRLGLIPHLAVESFLPGDIIVMATSGVSCFVSEDELRVSLEMSGGTKESLNTAVVHLLRTAEENGSTGNMTVCVIKRKRADE